MVFITDRARPPSPSSTWQLDLLLLWLGTAILLISVIAWFDNPQGGLTGNGIFKSMEMKPWIADPGTAPLAPSNYLYYPVYGLLCRGLDALGVHAGDPRLQMPILNALSASFCVCIVYAMVRRLTGDRVIAVIASLFHLASSFVLFLAITNEDIMPSYTVLFASMALAALWFAHPTPLRIVIVSVLFSIGWLFEWRLMFPTLPAMLAALWLCLPDLRKRIAALLLFLAGMLATAVVAALAGRGHKGAVGPVDLIWTGKAVDSAWAGFTWTKLFGTFDGGVAYLLGTAVTNYPAPFGWDMWRVIGMVMIVAIAAISTPMLWRRRDDMRARAVAAIFGGTFVAGLVFNLYSQPQDPQMQINVMGWLTVGWMLAVIAAYERWRGRGLWATGGLTLALLAYNIWSLAPLRGLDAAWQRSIRHIEHEAEPARTVFVINDLDWFMVYASLAWGEAEPGVKRLGPAPQAQPAFKWIGVGSGLLRHPGWSAEEHATALQGEIDRALDLGYHVVISQQWELDQAHLAATIAILSNQSHSGALWRMLHDRYRAELAFDDPLAGHYYSLFRKP
jgi:hypothetical protein